jgi:hypothetical protein
MPSGPVLDGVYIIDLGLVGAQVQGRHINRYNPLAGFAIQLTLAVQFSPCVGSPALSVQASGHDPRAQEVEPCSPVHGALDELELVDLAFD